MDASNETPSRQTWPCETRPPDRRPRATRRRLDRNDLAAISPLPPPEEVFADWLLSIPGAACLETAARRQIAIIDRSRAAAHPDVRCLRMLLAAIAGGGGWPPPLPNL